MSFRYSKKRAKELKDLHPEDFNKACNTQAVLKWWNKTKNIKIVHSITGCPLHHIKLIIEKKEEGKKRNNEDDKNNSKTKALEII